MRFWILAAVLSLWGMGLAGCSDDSASAPPAPANETVQKPTPPPAPPAPPPPPPEQTASPPPAQPGLTIGKPKAEEQKSTNPSAQQGLMIEKPKAEGAAANQNASQKSGLPFGQFKPVPKENNSAPSSPLQVVPPNRQAPAGSNNMLTTSPNGVEEIKLSAGVSLPQTGPEGILMSFSVDYELPGAPSNAAYVWVIERTQGKPAKVPARLTKSQGNLMAMIPGWRPNQGPFHAHLEDKSGKHVSASVELVGQE